MNPTEWQELLRKDEAARQNVGVREVNDGRVRYVGPVSPEAEIRATEKELERLAQEQERVRQRLESLRNEQAGDLDRRLAAVEAEVNAKNKDGRTALMDAAGNNNNPAVVKVLLDAGASVNARDKDGMTALMEAAGCNENPAVVKVLLDAGADLSARDKDGKTALGHAKRMGHTKVIKLLRAAGATE